MTHTIESHEKRLSDWCLARMLAMSQGVPGRLGHFTTAEGMRGILRSGRMWAHSVAEMNDATEIRHGVSAMRAHLERARATECDDLVLSMLEAIMRQTMPYSLDDVFVLSFTENAEDESMWRLYADRGRGFSFVFPLHLCAPWGGIPVKCNYSNEDLADFCRTALAEVRTVLIDDRAEGLNPNPDVYAATFVRHVAWFAPIFKQSFWSDENEWRIVFIRPDAERIRRGDGRQYIEVPARKHGRLPIEAICGGPTCDVDGVVRPLQQLANQHGYGGVPIHISQHHPCNGRLDR